MRLPNDPVLWRTATAPLLIFCRWAKPVFDRHGFRSRPFFYPALSLFKDPAQLSSVLKEVGDAEVILHPADRDDFAQIGVNDPYTFQRVIEFDGFQKATSTAIQAPTV